MNIWENDVTRTVLTIAKYSDKTITVNGNCNGNSGEVITIVILFDV